MSATIHNLHPMTPARREGALHPVITAADAARMTPHELVYFTDAPAAHVCAYLDFRRELMLDARRRDALAKALALKSQALYKTLYATAKAHGWEA